MHCIACRDGVPVGTGRLLPDGRIGRMAVRVDQRGQGVGRRILAPAMIVAPDLGYGTRASTLVAVRRDGRIETIERNWTLAGSAVRVADERRARFSTARRTPGR